ncbi:MAG: hypothetical protein ABEK36_03590 [Candidatus Aenigmatarchaeota archaeon]
MSVIFDNRKGQYLTLEQFVVFLIGIVITISIFLTFSSIRDKIEKTSKEDQLKEVGHFVVSGILNVYKQKDSEITHNLDVPKKIANKNYKLEVEGNELKVYLTGNKDGGISVDLESIEKEIDVFGIVYSSGGKIKITKRNNNIILGKV